MAHSAKQRLNKTSGEHEQYQEERKGLVKKEDKIIESTLFLLQDNNNKIRRNEKIKRS